MPARSAFSSASMRRVSAAVPSSSRGSHRRSAAISISTRRDAPPRSFSSVLCSTVITCSTAAVSSCAACCRIFSISSGAATISSPGSGIACRIISPRI